jgi:hypothetical protein
MAHKMTAVTERFQRRPTSIGLMASGVQLWECSQLALQYVELVLLAVCGHGGLYARRGWRGWKGEDEIVVPWGTTANI